MRRGRPLAELVLTVEENNRLIEFTRRRKSAQALALRARIVLACAQGTSNSEAADRLGVTVQSVGKRRSRFVRDRLDGLLGCASARTAPQDPGRRCRACTGDDIGEHTTSGYALEHAHDGQGERAQSDGGQPHLAGVCAAAASAGDVQALERSAVHR